MEVQTFSHFAVIQKGNVQSLELRYSPIQRSKSYIGRVMKSAVLKLSRIKVCTVSSFMIIWHIVHCSQCSHKNTTIRKFIGTSKEETKVYKAKNYVLATGVDSYRIGKQVGVTIPVYPLRGNLVTIPINVCIYKIFIVFIILQLSITCLGIFQ